MLKARDIPHHYREYTQDPLSEEEIRRVLDLLGNRPVDLLRRRDAAFKSLGLKGDESDDELIGHMSRHPTLLQRPIGIVGDRAIVGRPADRLLELVDG